MTARIDSVQRTLAAFGAILFTVAIVLTTQHLPIA
jgi:hypothetical protein